MSENNLNLWSAELKSALTQTLLRRFPTKESKLHLEDLIIGLINALSRGELEINLSKSTVLEELKAEGWPEAHKKALNQSGWIEGELSPMVLKGNLLSWRRWYEDMEVVIDEIRNRSSSTRIPITQNNKPQPITSHKNLTSEQEEAINAIKTKGVILLSGGPGTGKTSTVIMMLEKALYLNPTLKIGLAAPTGKAARRLKETVNKGIINITPSYKHNLSNIPCNTLHKWLEARPGGFGRNKKNKIRLDLLVIDEMSMVDLALIKALLEALPRESQLILVGDQHQLPPIGSGAIWHKLQQVQIRSCFGEGAVHLHKLYRNRGAIASLSMILREKPIKRFWDELNELPSSENIRRHIFNQSVIPSLVINSVQKHFNQLKKYTELLRAEIEQDFGPLNLAIQKLEVDSEKLFTCLEEFIVLSPQRHGQWGINHLHRTFLGNNFADGVTTWPEGTPVMCSENKSEFDLANGDIGVVIGEGEHRRIIFQLSSNDEKATIQLIQPARIKNLEPALAMTIHKAQGSEANKVMILWPKTFNEAKEIDQTTRKLDSYSTRLLYTGITRAKLEVDLITRGGADS